MSFVHLSDGASYERLIKSLKKELDEETIRATRLFEIMNKHEEELTYNQMELLKAQKGAINMVQSILRLRIDDVKRERDKMYAKGKHF